MGDPRLALGCLVFAMGPVVAADLVSDGEAASILHNPFERPSLVQAPVPRTEARESVADETPSWARKLKATSVSGAGSMANVDGVIVMLGDQLDGYTLIEVRERAAVFAKGERRRLLTLND